MSQKVIEIPEELINIYKNMDLSPILILKNYAINIIYNKVSKYEAEINFFKNKYVCSFEELKNKTQDIKNEENFEWDDDLLDWEFAIENFKYWQEQIKLINERIN
jgi:hypothetical protein